MFAAGLLNLALALAGLFFAIWPPVSEMRWGAAGVAVGCGIAAAVLLYLSAPGRRRPPPPGMVRGKARVLDAAGTTGSVAGYQMVELTLEVEPSDGGIPFQVKRKFSAGRLPFVAGGRRLDVFYDPANPERLELP